MCFTVDCVDPWTTDYIQDTYLYTTNICCCMYLHLFFGLCVVALLANEDEYNVEYFSNATDSRIL